MDIGISWEKLVTMASREVEKTVRALPPELRTEAEQVPVLYEAVPSAALQAEGIEADTLGLFTGGAFPDGETNRDPLPTQITLYLENLWELAEGDVEIYREEVRITLMHELGHYLGLDEEDLDERGL